MARTLQRILSKDKKTGSIITHALYLCCSEEPAEEPNPAAQLRVCLRSPRPIGLQAGLVKLHQHDPIRL